MGRRVDEFESSVESSVDVLSCFGERIYLMYPPHPPTPPKKKKVG